MDDYQSISTCLLHHLPTPPHSPPPGSTLQWSELDVFSKLTLAQVVLCKGEMLSTTSNAHASHSAPLHPACPWPPVGSSVLREIMCLYTVSVQGVEKRRILPLPRKGRGKFCQTGERGFCIWYFKIYFIGVKSDSSHIVNLLLEWKLGDRRFNITFNNEICHKNKAEIIQRTMIWASCKFASFSKSSVMNNSKVLRRIFKVVLVLDNIFPKQIL